jgi:A/G-specific adenine glycosylase
MPAPTGLAAARSRLLAWFAGAARDLPWRRTSDPYAIWVSEVMLQQTRVETVLGYWGRFLERFPTFAALAAAPEDEVLSLWSGLGYYRRARQLHAAAKLVVSEHGGAMPREREARRRLPGVGPYTSGAVGSIAFGLPEPIVDGNVARVLSRVHAIDAPLGSRDSERALWEHAARWVEGPRPGALNQALMELGGAVCTVGAPRCEGCPLASECQALRADRVALLPVPKARRAPKQMRLVALRVRTAEGVLFTRGQGALFGGLWGLPLAEVTAGRPAAVRAALTGLGIEPDAPPRKIGELEHVLTHRRLTVTLFEAEARLPGQARAFADAELSAVGVSALTRKLLAL